MNDIYLIGTVSFILGMLYVKLMDYLWKWANKKNNV